MYEVLELISLQHGMKKLIFLKCYKYIITFNFKNKLCRKRLRVPWRSILTSVPVWGIVLAHTAFNWGNYTLNQQLPTYFTSILR